MAVQKKTSAIKSSSKHLLGIQNLSIPEAKKILDEAKAFISLNRSPSKKLALLRGKTQINLFFEPSTRTQSSFDLAGKRLGADVMTMNVGNSALKKGETLIDTAMTLNAMHPDIIVIRHQDSGAPNLLSQKVNCAVINAGDGRREHPTQALLDALTIINRKGKIEGLKIAICGDILHSRVARSNIYLMEISQSPCYAITGHKTKPISCLVQISLLVEPKRIIHKANISFVSLSILIFSIIHIFARQKVNIQQH